jgi:hypothetical protein
MLCVTVSDRLQSVVSGCYCHILSPHCLSPLCSAVSVAFRLATSIRQLLCDDVSLPHSASLSDLYVAVEFSQTVERCPQKFNAHEAKLRTFIYFFGLVRNPCKVCRVEPVSTQGNLTQHTSSSHVIPDSLFALEYENPSTVADALPKRPVRIGSLFNVTCVA